MDGFINYEIWGNSVYEYIVCLSVFIISVLVIKIFSRFLLKRLISFSIKTRNTIDDFLVSVLRKIVVPIAYLGAVYLSLKTLNVHQYLGRSMEVLLLSLFVFAGAKFVIELVSYGFKLYSAGRSGDATLDRSLKGILKVVKVLAWGMALVIFLDNLGFKVSTVIAGLGIGGIAVGLAAQAVLRDLFSYFSIIFDRPFEVGDFIIVGDYLGTVEYIGAKTTRLRSLGGEQLIFSNTDLTDSRLRNYKRMDKRRVVFKLGVVYDTTLDRLKEIPGIIKDIVCSVEDTVFDRAHFFSYGDFSLIFEVVYYVIGSDYNKYMDIQQEINFALKSGFEKRNIEFAFPTQTVYLEKQGN